MLFFFRENCIFGAYLFNAYYSNSYHLTKIPKLTPNK
ncbi:hypothetical protein SAMN05444682_11479 [Parapedobacter indicus]|uniref:Uncharacterized protein n=1 Tax=Parapedobacter indicus TaxID=1477437 RepID=A0A1I3UBL5_9SPHI|nr:hypothetical protein CLV26_11479 [Parapedobacter indicus]SFJ80302.1 hypothetical protein SAMN05444682_11479 [Parapedobacter indicus]